MHLMVVGHFMVYLLKLILTLSVQGLSQSYLMKVQVLKHNEL